MGYGTTPVDITAKINGVTVFGGIVPTEINPPPALPNPEIDLGDPIFSWTHPDIGLAGTASIEITVNNPLSDDCFLYVTDTQANYQKPFNGLRSLYHYKGPDFYNGVFYEQIDNPEDPPPWMSLDPQTNVQIDGVPVGPHPTRDLPGQYYWRLRPQQTLTFTLNFLAGGEIPAEFDINRTYVRGDFVLYQDLIYGAKQTTTGNPPTDQTIWLEWAYI